MTDATDLQADYKAAWKALPRRDRIALTSAALKGHRSINRWDAAVTLWWVQRELRYGVRNALLTAAGFVVGWYLDRRSRKKAAKRKAKVGAARLYGTG